MNLYYVDSYEDSSVLDNFESKIKPKNLYFCPSKLKVVNNCSIIDEDVHSCKYYNSSICIIQNKTINPSNTIITRYIEGKISNQFSENDCSLCGIYTCREGFNLCNIDEHDKDIIKFIKLSLNTIKWRAKTFNIKDHIKDSSNYLNEILNLCNTNQLIGIAKEMIKENGRLIKEINFKKRIKRNEIKTNLGSIDKTKKNILYISNSNTLSKKVFDYLVKKKDLVNLLCMSCGGMEISANYNLPFLGSLQDEEYIINSGLIDAVIIDNGCVERTLIKSIIDKKIPLLQDCKIEKKVFTFINLIIEKENRERPKEIKFNKNKTYIGLTDEFKDQVEDKRVILIPGCSGSCLGGDFVDKIDKYLNDNSVIVFSGCNLVNVSNLGLFENLHYNQKKTKNIWNRAFLSNI